MDNFFSEFQGGFRKGYSTQQCLFSFGALLTDLSKAFYCLPHELLIAKLHSYGFSLNELQLSLDLSIYLIGDKRQQSMKAIAHGKKFYLVSLKDLF